MQRLVFVILGLILAGTIAFSVVDSRKGPPAAHGGQTSDRLTDAMKRRLVERPMTFVKRGDLAGGQRQFEVEYATMLERKGERSITPGDMLTAFGVGLWVEDHQVEAVPYFRRAVAAYRISTPDSPDVALALNTVADAVYTDDNAPPPAEALAAMREALKIRRATLGLHDGETAVTYVRLGKLNGHPVNTEGVEARVEAAAQQVRYGISLLPHCPNADPADLSVAYVTLAKIYARNGHTRQTIAVIEAARDRYHNGHIQELTDLLAAGGDPEGAVAFKDRFFQ